jgi:lipopolysaccharide export LptBFGC system permease protein LptF
MGLALLVMVMATIIVGYLSPHARYGYNVLKRQAAEASLTAAVLGGAFIHVRGVTFFAENVQPTTDGLQLTKVFVHQQEANGDAASVVTGEEGLLGQARDSKGPVLILQQGLRTELPEDGRLQTLTFDNLSWPVVADPDEVFPPRGRHARELTLPELWTVPATPSSDPNTAEIGAELHARLVQIATVPLLPVLAALLVLTRTQRNPRGSIVIGLLILVVYYEALSFGEALAKRELVAPGLGLWLPFLVLAFSTGWLYLRTQTGSRLSLRQFRPRRWHKVGGVITDRWFGIDARTCQID